MRSMVAIVGRPNVGKSTLLNRILGRREAIVEERPGVTRDRKEVEASWQGREFTLVDTGGWMADGNSLDEKVSRQSERAIADADAVLFVVDATVGVTEDDARVAGLLRSVSAPVLVVANKVDDRVHEAAVWELMSLGLGEPAAVSALHGRGTGDLLDRLVAELPDEIPVETTEDNAGSGERIVGVTLVGRPNVGKSTFFNRVLSQRQAIVDAQEGITRDRIYGEAEWCGHVLRFIDTGGFIPDDMDVFNAAVREQAQLAIDEADLIVFMVDGREEPTTSDLTLAQFIRESARPYILVVNKCDTLKQDDQIHNFHELGME